jgi:hypothetical protein
MILVSAKKAFKKISCLCTFKVKILFVQELGTPKWMEGRGRKNNWQQKLLCFNVQQLTV